LPWLERFDFLSAPPFRQLQSIDSIDRPAHRKGRINPDKDALRMAFLPAGEGLGSRLPKWLRDR
jgi:hypothetical protein